MKKIVSSLFVCTLAIMMSFSSVFATGYDTSKIETAYNKVVNYYENNKNLENDSFGLDAIIAVETLGLEVEDNYEILDLKNYYQNYKDNYGYDITASTLSKLIIAQVLSGVDPTNLNGENLIEKLNSMINEDGTIDGNAATDDIWVLFALESVNSDKIELVANHLANENNEDGGFWYTYNGNWSDPQITAWGIEALIIAEDITENSYDESIKKALNYLDNTKVDAAYGYDAEGDGDTQSCVLEALIVYDKEGLLDGKYDVKNVNPIDIMLNFQLDDGSFKIADYVYNPDTDWYDKTGTYSFNFYTTVECARTLGTYKNGSFVLKAQKAYEALTTKPEENKPADVSKPQETQKAVSNTKTKSVETGDNTQTMLFISISVVSGGLYLVLRKEYERVH